MTLSMASFASSRHRNARLTLGDINPDLLFLHAQFYLREICVAEEVKRDHVCTKSGRVAPYTTPYKCKSRSKALKTVLNVKAS